MMNPKRLITARLRADHHRVGPRGSGTLRVGALTVIGLLANAVVASAQSDRVVSAAFLAQRGFDQVCMRESRPATLRLPQLARRAVVVRQCPGEHGGADTYFVGIVRGQAIPLNSRDNLSYFLRLGPSPTVDSANVVQYLKVVLPLMGTDGDAGAIVTEETAIPDSVRAQLGERNLLPEVHPGIVGSLVVTLYAMSPNNPRMHLGQ